MEVEFASVDDFEGIWKLISEESVARSVGKEELYQDGFGDHKLFEYIIAKYKGKIIGLVSIFNLYSTWEGHFIFIDDFVSSPYCLDMNVDELLLRKTIEVALHRNSSRVQFFTNRNDTVLLEKYTKLGGVCLPEWLTVRLNHSALTRFANEDQKINGQFSIRPAIKEDVKSILYLIQCLAEYENEPLAVKINEDILLEDGFGSKVYYECLIAESLNTKDTNDDSIESSYNHKVVGMALYLTIYCKRKGKVLHLEDLYVREEFRNRGIGTALMKGCAKIALSKKCKEMDWQVLDWNTKAIDLYARLGGQIDHELVFVRFTKETMKKLAI